MDKSRILVIDDEESIRFTFERFLRNEDYAVSTAMNYDEALALINQEDFDVIFADILLGDRTGIDILEEVKRRKIRTPMVMVTGAPNIETASKAVRLGAFDYISKPVDKERLLRVTGLALQHKAVLDQNEKYRSNLEAVFRSVKDAIITVDPDLVVLEVNGAAENNCGLPRQQAIGRSFKSLPLVCDGQCIDILRKTLVQKKALEIHRVKCRGGKRSGRVVTLTTSPLLDGQGSFCGAVLVVRDETRLADLERDLNERRRFHNLIGRNEKMQKIYGLIEDLADVQSTVLITGESGTGKELVAEALHYRGRRSRNPLVKVNCSALPENLLETELFGHVKGAFTGAIRDKIGRFERADGGTLFLDEIGDLSPGMQLRLLRVLQENEFEKVGDSTPIRVDVRVVAATNRNLKQKVRDGKFREDLYYRIKQKVDR
jgi:PAS domain S-box-containing protein